MRILKKKASGNNSKKMMTQRPLKSYPTWWEGAPPLYKPFINTCDSPCLCLLCLCQHSHLLRTHVKLLTFPLLGFCLLTLFVYACVHPFINKSALCRGIECVHKYGLKKKYVYCPQSFSGGGLYSKQNGLLLWSVIGDCDYGVCGYCNAFDLATVRRLDWLL